MALKAVRVYLSDDAHEQIKTMASDMGISMSYLMRRAMEIAYGLDLTSPHEFPETEDEADE